MSDIRHFQTILKHLQAAQDEPDCRPLLAELVLALHPWPKRWGYWVSGNLAR